MRDACGEDVHGGIERRFRVTLYGSDSFVRELLNHLP